MKVTKQRVQFKSFNIIRVLFIRLGSLHKWFKKLRLQTDQRCYYLHCTNTCQSKAAPNTPALSPKTGLQIGVVNLPLLKTYFLIRS